MSGIASRFRNRVVHLRTNGYLVNVPLLTLLSLLLCAGCSVATSASHSAGDAGGTLPTARRHAIPIKITLSTSSS